MIVPSGGIRTHLEEFYEFLIFRTSRRFPIEFVDLCRKSHTKLGANLQHSLMASLMFSMASSSTRSANASWNRRAFDDPDSIFVAIKGDGEFHRESSPCISLTRTARQPVQQLSLTIELMP